MKNSFSDARMKSLNWTGALRLSLLLTAPKNTGTVVLSVEYLSSEVGLYLFNCSIQGIMECCHDWAGASGCDLMCWITNKNGLLVLYLMFLLTLRTKSECSDPKFFMQVLLW